MKKTPEEILSEIKELAKELSFKMELLENKYVELEEAIAGKGSADTLFEPVDEEDDTIDIDIEIEGAFDAVMPADVLPEKMAEPVLQEEQPVYAEAEAEPLEMEDVQPIRQGVSAVQAAEAVAAPVAVLDAMAEKQAWRKDIPGTEVKDVRSAISLNDRILFIRSLFSDDAVLFQGTLDRINSMGSMDEAADWLVANFPGWNFESDTVYRFMMAVRRKLR